MNVYSKKNIYILYIYICINVKKREIKFYHLY